ncbi:hypothetical protein C8250_000760 [Streptomyces sp. So13.3]|uniref:hypothetical protein n=1 Tax=Streptomyces TaxID=1883 RepID=UPI00164EA095|nr:MULTISPECIES: hypothetical protein [Streptomyces]MCZ4101749.1 hypothetical protein [Streptomyces sp. H39-C1]QNA70675.1 hypothetical protein C8250_000760 [Streptomyces sp. So13.3]
MLGALHAPGVVLLPCPGALDLQIVQPGRRGQGFAGDPDGLLRQGAQDLSGPQLLGDEGPLVVLILQGGEVFG